MNKIKFNILKRAAVAAAILLLVCSCGYDGEIAEGNRSILIDIENSMFNSQSAENPWEQGPGITKVVFTIELDVDSGNVTQEFAAADIDAAYDFSQLSVDVLGRLLSVSAVAYAGDVQKFSVVIDDAYSPEEFEGWQVFANVTKFKLVFSGNSEDWDAGYLNMDICPRGKGVSYLVDSGVTAPGEELTDWGGTALSSRQLAIEPILQEHPAGVTFDIYALIVEEDLRRLYKVGYGGEVSEYTHFQWADIWEYSEVTETGRAIGYSEDVYTLEKFNDKPLNFIEPSGAGCGYNSILIDLNTASSDPLGKYLMYCLVMKYGVLEVVSPMDIVEIK